MFTISDGSVSEWSNAVPITPVQFDTPPSSVASIDLKRACPRRLRIDPILIPLARQ